MSELFLRPNFFVTNVYYFLFSKLDEERTSMEFDHLNEHKGSCFQHLYDDQNNLTDNKNFSIEGTLFL